MIYETHEPKAPQLANASLKCLRCSSVLNLQGRHAQSVAENGICPICHWQGAMTMTSFKVTVNGGAP